MNEQNAHTPPQFPRRPRFTLDTLQEIRLSAGDGETTAAAYIFTHRGKTAEKIATLEDLNRTEKAATLAFILQHAPAAVVKRKKAKKPRKEPRLYLNAPADLEPVDLDGLTPPELPEMELPDLEPETGELAGNPAEKGTPTEEKR